MEEIQNTNVEETKVDNVENETTQKTYTKEDLDNSFNAGVRKANTEWQKDAKFKEFQEWKKTNQNDSEKIAELETNNSNLLNENKMLKAQILVNTSEVKKEFSKFVTSEVMQLVDENTTFEKALENYKKENPHFFGETVVKKVQSSPSLIGGNQPQTTNDIMNGILRGNK